MKLKVEELGKRRLDIPTGGGRGLLCLACIFAAGQTLHCVQTGIVERGGNVA